MNGEIFVSATESGNKMIFECLDCPFSCIVAMEVWQDQLEVNTFLLEIVLEYTGGFVVKALEFGL